MIFGHKLKRSIEDWIFDFEWLRTQHYVKEQMGTPELPDLNGLLFLIGLQELGKWKKAFTKEEKQDLMHIAVCRLLSIRGYYEFKGRDQDGWPHFEQLKKISANGLENQEQLLKELIIIYFKDLQAEHEYVSDAALKSMYYEEE